MSTASNGVASPTHGEASIDAKSSTQDQIECAKLPAQNFPHSPPDSNSNHTHKSDASDSELSDLDEEPILDHPPSLPDTPPESHRSNDEEVDIGEVLPDHWTNGVPVFKPTMDQFKDFNLFMRKVDSYGMKSGIIKIIPPKEWKDAQPPLDDLVKQVRVREPIKQDIMGSNGTYRQVNILHGRSYNIPQWRQLCEQSEHQPPARRGERRANADKPRLTRSRAAAAKPSESKPSESAAPRKRGRPPKNKGKTKSKDKHAAEEDEQRPITPISPNPETQDLLASVEDEPEQDDLDDQPPVIRRMGGIRPAKAKIQSTSARRKYSRREGSAAIDEAAFKDFDYRMDISEYTPERCEELERSYWKTLTYAQPLYGADLMGTLFDDQTEIWNLNKLPNLLDVLGTKVPGVNTAYLYLGMWKATFAWHLEDVDLYSINYLHFGAPKQWYSISQADARRFEAAMKSIWPTDAKACDQFLRHKAFLISPQHLLQHYGIKVNKCVSYPGEFVVTYPYGYHSGYNLGYNCAEAVNFALDSWLEMGKIAKKCECAQAQDSVWVSVQEIERKLRGEETEYEETDEEEEEDEEDAEDDASGLPSPPASHGTKPKEAGRKRKRGAADRGAKIKVKKIKLRLKTKAEPPCCLCPNDIAGMEVLPTDDGRKAHRICALYLPETYIDMVDGKEIVSNVTRVHKDRLDLKCLFCRSKRGACFQCSQKKCARAYHATCAAAAGVFIEEQDVPVFGEDGTEYKEQAFEFSCRFHRTRRDKKLDGNVLEEDQRILTAAKALKKGDVCQMQYYRSDIFAGIVIENRPDEQTMLLDVLPNGDRIEVEWKWLLLPDPSDYHLPKASANAIPMPASQKAKDMLNAKRQKDDKPRKDDEFVPGYTWAEFNFHTVENTSQARVNLGKSDQIWYYLPTSSTDAKAQYTEDPAKPRYNPKGNYLDTIPKPPKPVAAPRVPQHAHSSPATYSQFHPGSTVPTAAPMTSRPEKPYVYKPKVPHNVGASTSASGPATHAPTAHQWQLTQGQGTAQPVYQTASPNPPRGHNVGQGQFQVAYGTPPRQHLQLAHHQQSVANSQVSMTTTFQHHHGKPAPTNSPSAAPAQQTYQQKKPTWQVYTSVYQQYAFFQVHHNRESSKYRTPYATWGGFTNGYQGDVKAHYMNNQNELLRRVSAGSHPTPSHPGPGFPAPGSSYSSIYNRTSTNSIGPAQNVNSKATTVTHQPTYNHTFQVNSAGRKQSVPRATSQGTQSPTQQPVSVPSTVMAKPAVKAYKVGVPAAVNPSLNSTKSATQAPPKQSPVPLPANFLAAMTSSPATPSPLSNKATPTEDSGAQSGPEGQISMTPVPLPKIPALVPNQAVGAGVVTTHNNSPSHAGNSPTAGIQSSEPQAVTTRPGGPSFQQGMHIEGKPAPSGAHMQGGLYARTSEAAPEPGSAPDGDRPQEFADVPGRESMQFVERMMQNLRRASQHVSD
ncbi:hypothetical protein B0I35DRAFT_450522 [Stachybotrys elegans]|uniref:[histone H3]-trimethyl-L-lysine(9) demethylase n=1 Tax=Stachybotrys elegans TaxID=80388 RepID=A0A8K0WT77_9HYPO|nr:hypothetical protein B0I35DRAFT_450522 [Stachybotrys elegans]